MGDKHSSEASKKITDPFIKPYPYFHVTTLDRLKNILVSGLVSPNYAKNILNEEIKRNFDSSWNDESVSLFSNTSPRRVTAPNIAILLKPNIEVESDVSSSTKDKNAPIPKEVLVKDFIKPENFIGLIIGGVGWDFELEKPITPKPLDVSAVIDVIKSLDAKFSLPIYFKGKLVWPK